MTHEMARRLAIVTRLVEKAGSSLGRTAIMKLVYFLTKLRNVQLGYHFTLYSYGPFDSTVLEDIDYGARLGALKVAAYSHSGGYGYDITAGDNAEAAKALAMEFVAQHDADIEWVAREFSRMSTADLELASTIVYIDREISARARTQTDDEIVRRVNEVKPQFLPLRIKGQVDILKGKGLLCSLGR